MSSEKISYSSSNGSAKNPGSNPSGSFSSPKSGNKQDPTESTSLLGQRANTSGTDVPDKKPWYRPW